VPTGGAIPIFRYSSGEVAGIRYEGDTKLIHLGFSINDIESAETRAELWRRIFAWFERE
jgi:hydrogenase maturation factor